MEAKKEYEVYLDRDFENWVLYCRADRTIYERQTTNELRDAVETISGKIEAPSLVFSPVSNGNAEAKRPN